MGETERRVRQAAQDAAADDSVGNLYEDMVWDGDTLVPRASRLDKETLDERAARGMGERWEETRRGG